MACRWLLKGGKVFFGDAADSHVAKTSKRGNLPSRMARFKQREDIRELVLRDRLHDGGG